MSGPRQVGPWGMTAFVPNGSGGYSRKDLAILLLGAAEEAGLDPTRAVASSQGGFYISDELADLLYDESDSEPESEPEQEGETEVSGNPDGETETKVEPEAPQPTSKRSAKKKASGNRAAKNSTAEKE